MLTAALLLALVVAVLAVTALAERWGVPAPLLLVIAGGAAAYLPFVPEVRLSPEVVLLGLLPPLLYAASLSTSLVDFAANKRTILFLSVGLVVFTTLGVGAVVHAVLPAVGWPAALAFGAVVAPPDAVAATAIGRRIGLPRRVVTILEGESLLNDATALVALRTAVLAATTTVTTLGVLGDFTRAVVLGVGSGFVVFVLVAGLRKRRPDPLLDTAISFVTPYGAYLAAESIHASGVLAVVIAGLLLGHKAPIVQTARSRLTERITWSTVAFLLENTVFFLIGLQARGLVQDVTNGTLPTLQVLLLCLAALASVVALRFVWLFAVRLLLAAPGMRDRVRTVPSTAYTTLVGWAGMRGVVTLAAAFVIPESTPHRSTLVLAAFLVVAGTLLLQGTTLPWVARRLRVVGPDPAEDALARATLVQQAGVAGLAELDRLAPTDPAEVVALVRQRVDQRSFSAWERLSTAGEESPSAAYARLRLAMLEAERGRVLEVRSSGRVPSDVVREVLGMLDLEESMLESATEARAEIRTSTVRAGGGCADLVRYDGVPAEPVDSDLECARCVEDGTRWVALRRCLACGAVGCCDSSPGQHATAHFEDSGHPVMQSAEPGETWRWCYTHHLTA